VIEFHYFVRESIILIMVFSGAFTSGRLRPTAFGYGIVELQQFEEYTLTERNGPLPGSNRDLGSTVLRCRLSPGRSLCKAAHVGFPGTRHQEDILQRFIRIDAGYYMQVFQTYLKIFQDQFGPKTTSCEERFYMIQDLRGAGSAGRNE
jgi:hypothetical protein